MTGQTTPFLHCLSLLSPVLSLTDPCQDYHEMRRHLSCTVTFCPQTALPRRSDGSYRILVGQARLCLLRAPRPGFLLSCGYTPPSGCERVSLWAVSTNSTGSQCVVTCPCPNWQNVQISITLCWYHIFYTFRVYIVSYLLLAFPRS